MKFLTPIITFIEETSENKLIQYIIIALGIIIAALGLLMYWHFNSLSYYQGVLQRVNSSRKQVKVILNKNRQVEKEKDQVDDMLDQDPNFNLQQYFEQINTNLGIQSASITSATIDRGEYSERNVTATFAGITMKLLTKLLQEIEQNLRINVKELDITPGKGRTIDVTITIATLQKKSETFE